MAGFFGLFDYTKPGPGVPKDAPPRARIIVFFEVLGRKFWNLVKMNLMFTLFNLPAIIAVVIATFFIFQNYLSEDPAFDLLLRFVLGSLLICVPVITVGPAQAGYTYILRNYSREEHAFLWWDFKDTALKNFKESLIISILDFIFVVFFGIALNFYIKVQTDSILPGLAIGFLLMAFVIFLMMHLYIYPMLITFKLTVRQVYKNAFIFALAKFFPNLGILLLCFLILQVTFIYPVIGIILFLFITVSFIGLIINFYSYPKLKKYIIDRMPAEEDSEEDSEDTGDDGLVNTGEMDSANTDNTESLYTDDTDSTSTNAD